MPPSRTAPITATASQRARFARARNQFQRIWALNVQPLIHSLRDLLLALLSLFTVEFFRGTVWYPSKYASLLVVLVIGFVLAQLGLDSQFYVGPDNVHLFIQSPYEMTSFDSRLVDEDIWGFEHVLGRHILWQNPVAIQEGIRANPFVAETKVTLLLPATLIVTVQEVAPALFWVTSESHYAVTHEGQAWRVREPSAQIPLSHPTLYDWNARAALNRPLLHAAVSHQLDPDLVHTMLTIQERYQQHSFWRTPPHHFHFTHQHGLQFTLPASGTRIYWGDSLNTERKLANLAGIEAYLAEQKLEAERIDLRPISRPYFR